MSKATKVDVLPEWALERERTLALFDALLPAWVPEFTWDDIAQLREAIRAGAYATGNSPHTWHKAERPTTTMAKD